MENNETTLNLESNNEYVQLQKNINSGNLAKNELIEIKKVIENAILKRDHLENTIRKGITAKDVYNRRQKINKNRSLLQKERIQHEDNRLARLHAINLSRRANAKNIATRKRLEREANLEKKKLANEEGYAELIRMRNLREANAVDNISKLTKKNQRLIRQGEAHNTRRNYFIKYRSEGRPKNVPSKPYTLPPVRGIPTLQGRLKNVGFERRISENSDAVPRDTHKSSVNPLIAKK